MRTKTEQARFVSIKLAKAEAALDRRLEIAKQRKAEVGFVKEVLASSDRELWYYFPHRPLARYFQLRRLLFVTFVSTSRA